MKTKTLSILGFIFLACLVAFAADRFRNDGRWIGPRNDPAIVIVKPTGHTDNFIEAYIDTTLKWAVPYSGVAAVAYGGTGSNAGPDGMMNLGAIADTVLVSADGTVTNTFRQTQARTPILAFTPTSHVPLGSNQVRIVTLTRSNVVIFGHTNTTYHMVGITPPTPL